MKFSEYQGLELNEDFPFHRRMWVIQRAGWVLMAICVAAAALGFFGLGGPWSSVEEKRPWGRLTYDRFLRWQGPTSLELLVFPDQAQNGEIRILISNDYIRRMKTDTIFPIPKSIFVQSEHSQLVFDVSPSSGGGHPFFLRWEATEIGSLTGEIGLAGRNDPFELRQWVYP